MSNGKSPLRPLYFFVGLALMPLVVGVAAAICDIAPSALASANSVVSREAIAFIAGFTACLLLFIILPPASRTYVLGHELTHAAWGLLTAQKIGRMKIGRDSGYVELSNPGVFTTLAPYFVPFYVVVILLLRLIAGFFIDMAPYATWWIGAIGFAYGFHVIYTVKTISEHQTDITMYGNVFALTLVALLNLLILGYGLAFLMDVGIAELHSALIERAAWSYSGTWHAIAWSVRSICELAL